MKRLVCGGILVWAEEILLKMHDSWVLHYWLFPRLRWGKEASQPPSCQRVVFVDTNMLVFVCG